MNITSETPWIEKYRPASLSEVISNKEIVRSLKKFIAKDTLPHLLFYGPSGCGKTSTIKCIAKQIYGEYKIFATLELNASNDRGIDVVRTTINEFIESHSMSYIPLENRKLFKLVILDEFDSMTVDAQGMLRRIIEENSDYIRFCLICNDIEKVTPAIQSRCAAYQFKPLRADDMRERLEEIVQAENLTIDNEALDGIIDISNKDMRNAINILYQSFVVSGQEPITVETVYRITGFISPTVSKAFFTKLLKIRSGRSDLASVVKEINAIIQENNVTISNFLECMRSRIISSNLPDKLYLIEQMARLEIGDALTVSPFVTIMGVCSLFVS